MRSPFPKKDHSIVILKKHHALWVWMRRNWLKEQFCFILILFGNIRHYRKSLMRGIEQATKHSLPWKKVLMKKGEIWIIDIPGLGGHEQRGRRPAIILADTVTSIVIIVAVIFSVSLFVPAVASAQDITSGLVGHWKFDEISGTTAADSSGNNNTGTLTNGPTWATGKINNALSFDGTDDYINLGNMNVSGSGITIAAWVKADTFSSSLDTRFISKANSTSEQGHYWMLGQTNSGGDELRFRLKAGGSTQTLIASSGDLPTGTWFHAIATYDGSTMRLYKDGIEVGSVAKSGTIDIDATIPANIARNP